MANFSRKSPADIFQGARPEDFSPQQLYIIQSFQSQVYIQDKMDVQDEPIYDTLTFAQAATITEVSSQWFTTIGPAAGKTLADTNMRRSQTLIAPEAQAVFGYRLKWNEDLGPADALAITKGFAFVFYMGTKAYQTCPLDLVAAGGGIYQTSTANTTAAVTNTTWLHNGFPSEISAAALSVNLVIENEESFYANLQGIASYPIAGTVSARLQCRLMGLHARPIR